MDKQQLYDKITDRKIKPKDFEPYDGNNGRVNRCADLIRRNELRAGGTLLDVGGGIGDLGYAVRDLFDRTFVLDISIQNLDAARYKGNEAFLADVDAEGLNFDDESINLTVALDFIEHIIDPEYFARECFRVLKPGGQVFVNTPNIRYWRHIEQLWFGGNFPHTSGDREVYHGGHLAFYTFSDLRDIFSSAGFTSCTQIKDEEGYDDPSVIYSQPLLKSVTSQEQAKQLLMELGCPNLLFKCEKPA